MTKAERTRQFIIEQAAPIFNTKGLAATAMSDVMDATKMAKGGLYGHFPSKDDLAYAVVDYNLKKLTDRVGQAMATGSTAREKLFAYLDLFKDPTQFPVDGGCPILNFGVESDDLNQVVKEKVRSVIVRSQKRAADLVNEGIRQGEFKESFDATLFAIKMMTLIEGGTLIGRVLNSDSQMVLLINMLKAEIDSYTM